jgi:predicted PurR-regulated permease PerM
VVEDNSPSAIDRPYLPYRPSLVVALVTLVLVSICGLIMRPFLDIIAWALAFAVAVRPMSTWLKRKTKNQFLASFLVVFIGTLVISMPASWVIRVLVTASVENVASIISQPDSTAWFDPTTAPRYIAPLLSWLEQSFRLQATFESFINSIEGRLPDLVTLTLVTIVKFALVLFTAFFFIKDEAAFSRYVKWLSPLSSEETTFVASRVLDTIHACLFGIVLMAILQGCLGAFIFWWLKLPQPALWGTVMGLLAIVPYLGAFIIWVPTAVVLAMHGAWTDAIILSAWGGIVIGLADNFLYPVLVGKRLHYHALLIFFFLLGGVIVFGSSGVVLGPIALSVTHSLLKLWRGEEAEPWVTGAPPPITNVPIEPPVMGFHAPS